jgi:ubiquitin-like 1-activating enzyme E1 A
MSENPGDDSQLSITADEIALYDRQIRLWGVQAQENIRKAKVLLIGIKGLGNEVSKNLVLAGIHSLTVADHEPVIPADLGAQFFVTEDDIGKNVSEPRLHYFVF